MVTTIYQSKIVEMSAFKNLFIELTAKNCNQRCKHCYIDFPMYKKAIDYIDIDIIKQALCDISHENICCIYLTGAEPMMHPDFNAILRLCLKHCDVCICTNGSFINEKKARFLKKVEDESCNEIIFKLSLNHYEEIKNDDVRYRGAYRHTVFAIKHLVKYGFNYVVNVANYYDLPSDELYKGIKDVFRHNNIEITNSNIQIVPWHDKEQSEVDSSFEQCGFLDCATGRVLSANGVYSCPFLSNDYRGRCGSTFTDYSKKCVLETTYCATCSKSGSPLFSIDYERFEK